MNKVILMGRLTAEPQVSYSSSNQGMAIARYTLAVDRRMAKKEDGKQDTDFINCVTFGKSAEFAEKYFHKGQRVLIEGRIQTGSYTDKDGNKKYTTNVVIDSQEFADSKQGSAPSSNNESAMDGFANIPDAVDDEDLPFE